MTRTSETATWTMTIPSAKAKPESADPDRRRCVLELGVDVRPRRLQRRRKAEEDDGHERRSHREENDAVVQAEIERGRLGWPALEEQRRGPLRASMPSGRRPPRGARTPSAAAGRPGARGAQRKPDRDFFSTRRRARQQHRGDIDARNPQEHDDARHDGREDPQPGALWRSRKARLDLRQNRERAPLALIVAPFLGS